MKMNLCSLAAAIGLAVSGNVAAQNFCEQPSPDPVGGGVVCGISNVNNATNSTALGFNNFADAFSSSVIGTANISFITAVGASAVGNGNTVSSELDNAFGSGNSIIGASSNAFGSDNNVNSATSNAFGSGNDTTGTFSNAFGIENRVAASDGSAFGTRNLVFGAFSNAMGRSNLTSRVGSFAAGTANTAVGAGATAVGGWLDGGNGFIDFEALFDSDGNLVLDEEGNAIQFTQEAATAVGIGATAFGAGSLASGDGAVALGRDALAFSAGTVAVGHQSFVTGQNGVALGQGAEVLQAAANSVAIGAGSRADRANTFSVGDAGAERQIVNVAAASADTDAANLGQLRTAAAAFGGGADFGGGAFVAPTYVIQGDNFNDVGAAFDAVDQKLTELDAQVGGPPGPEGPIGPVGPVGPAGPQGPEGPAGGGPRSVVYDDDAGTTLTLKGAQGTRVANVADGAAPTDAANVRQVQAGDAQTLTEAKAYTDQRFLELVGADFGDLRREIDDRFQRADRRTDRVGAMSSAMVQMTANAANGNGARGRIAVGAGIMGGEQALSVGYGKRLGERASFTLGGAFSGDDSSAGIGFGVDL